MHNPERLGRRTHELLGLVQGLFPKDPGAQMSVPNLGALFVGVLITSITATQLCRISLTSALAALVQVSSLGALSPCLLCGSWLPVRSARGALMILTKGSEVLQPQDEICTHFGIYIYVMYACRFVSYIRIVYIYIVYIL